MFLSNIPDTVVNYLRHVDENSERAASIRIPVTARDLSRSTRGPRSPSDYMMLSVPVRPDGDDGNTAPEKDGQSRFDGLLQMELLLERILIEIRKQQIVSISVLSP